MKRIMLGVGSFLFPLLSFALCAFFLVSSPDTWSDEPIPAEMIPLLVAAVALVFLVVGGLWFFILYDIVHAARNAQLSNAARAGWIGALWCLNMFVIPLYCLEWIRAEAGSPPPRRLFGRILYGLGVVVVGLGMVGLLGLTARAIPRTQNACQAHEDDPRFQLLFGVPISAAALRGTRPLTKDSSSDCGVRSRVRSRGRATRCTDARR